jgi:hypothetical protein
METIIVGAAKEWIQVEIALAGPDVIALKTGITDMKSCGVLPRNVKRSTGIVPHDAVGEGDDRRKITARPDIDTSGISS